MSNRYYPQDKTITINIPVTIKISSVSDYNVISDERMERVYNEFEESIVEHLAHKISSESVIELDSVDYVHFEIK